MEPIFKLRDVAKAVAGELCCCDEEAIVTSVSTDTRTISQGALFFALKGENSDGHIFAQKAIEAGAVACVVCSDATVKADLPVIKVKNTGQALLDLAGAYRREMKIPIVAVTGSVGKTSTRTMIGNVLSQKYNTLMTEGNFNNEIGVPHTLFRLNSKHQIAVVEMGMSNFGELSRITAAVLPDTVVITNIGESHIENLGSREGILKAKLESLEGLKEGGTVILNGDDDMLWSLNGTLDFETLYYGIDNKKSDVVATRVNAYSDETEFAFSVEEKEYKAKIGVPGRHHVYNGLSSILVGMKYNVPINDIIAGMREFAPVGLRQAIEKIGDYTVIKDCYNANPTSMKAGLDILRLNESGERRVACLGDMLELGTISEKAHLGIGKVVYEYGIDCLITIGERAMFIADGAVLAGMDKKNVYSFKTKEDAYKNLPKILKEKDVILLKASRGMRLEQVAEFMEENMK